MSHCSRHIHVSKSDAASTYCNKETISRTSYPIPIDPANIPHALSTSILPVIQQFHESMSTIRWTRKSCSISHQYQGSEGSLFITFLVSTGMSFFSTLTVIKEVHQIKWELLLCLSVWLWSCDVPKQLSIFWTFYLHIYVDGIGCMTNQSLYYKTSCSWDHNLTNSWPSNIHFWSILTS